MDWSTEPCKQYRPFATKAAKAHPPNCQFLYGLYPVVIEVGKSLPVACSRVCKLTDLLFNLPFLFQRIANLAKSSQRLQERPLEDARFCTMETTSLPDCPVVIFHNSDPPRVDISSSETSTPTPPPSPSATYLPLYHSQPPLPISPLPEPHTPPHPVTPSLPQLPT